MISPRLKLAFPRLACLLGLLILPGNALPQGVLVYDNSSLYLDQYETDQREYGDQIHLTGVARNLTDFFFEYYGGFTQEGDERARIRFYANDESYDQWRQQPGTILYDSGNFPINPGYNSKAAPGLAAKNVVVPDIFTFTIEFSGLEEGETAGLLIYGPPTEGSSFNEFWIRTGPNRFDVFQYPGGTPKANFAARVLAVPEPGVWTLLAAGAALALARLPRRKNKAPQP